MVTAATLAPPQPQLEWSDDWADMLDELDPPLEAQEGNYDDDFWVVTVVLPEVLRCAAEREGVAPRDVSRPQFDNACGPAGHPLCRSAQVIHRDRLNMGWQEAKDLALGPPAPVSAVLKARRTAAEKPVEVTDAVIDARVRDAWSILVRELIADGVPENEARAVVLTRDDYARISDERRPTRTRHVSVVQVRWPTMSQVDVRGGLTVVLERLGLPTTPVERFVPAAEHRERRWTRRDRVAALAECLKVAGNSSRNIQLAYRAWREEQPEPDTVPPAAAFAHDNTFTRLRDLGYKAIEDPTILDGDLALPDDRHVSSFSDPLRRALADTGGRELLAALELAAQTDWLTGTEAKTKLSGDKRSIGTRLSHLSALGALDERRIAGAPGKAKEYRLTAIGAEVLDMDPSTREPLPKVERPGLTATQQQTVDALRALQPATTRQVADLLKLKTHQAAKDRLDTLVGLEVVTAEKDVHGPGNRQLYRLADAA